MTENDKTPGREFALLEDIARLLRKHGPKAFEGLAMALEDPARARHILAVLHAGAVAGATRSSGVPKRDRLSRITARLATGSTDEEKVLFPLAQELDAGVLEPTFGDVRRAVDMSGLPPLRAKKRRDALGEVIEDLLTLRSPEFERAFEAVRSAFAPTGRSLAGWDDLIERSRSETRE